KSRRMRRADAHRLSQRPRVPGRWRDHDDKRLDRRGRTTLALLRPIFFRHSYPCATRPRNRTETPTALTDSRAGPLAYPSHSRRGSARLLARARLTNPQGRVALARADFFLEVAHRRHTGVAPCDAGAPRHCK